MGQKKTQDHYEITPKLLKKVERLAAQGLTIVQIAHCIGWSEETIHAKKKKHSEFSESIGRGQSKGIQIVTNSLIKKAKGFNYKEIHEEARLDTDGKVTKHKKVIKKKVPPDTNAQIFYLKNRDPQNWRDRQDHNISGDVVIKIDSDDAEI